MEGNGFFWEDLGLSELCWEANSQRVQGAMASGLWMDREIQVGLNTMANVSLLG